MTLGRKRWVECSKKKATKTFIYKGPGVGGNLDYSKISVSTAQGVRGSCCDKKDKYRPELAGPYKADMKFCLLPEILVVD